MGLLERAAMEAAKKMAESEESHTDTRGIVKASKVFPVVSIASILLALGMAFLKHRQSDAAFYVLSGVFAVLGICLLIYGHNFRIEYDRTGITVYNFFGKEICRPAYALCIFVVISSPNSENKEPYIER